MTVKPLGDRVLVKLKEKEEVTASGIVLPDTVDKKEKSFGEVVAIGPGKLLENGERSTFDVKEGDQVLFKKWGGEDLDDYMPNHKIISSEDIMAIVS